MQKLLQGHIPLIEVETNGACSSQCCDDVISATSSSSSESTNPKPKADNNSNSVDHIIMTS